MKQNSRIDAVGFDLGETLLHYGDAPLSWEPLYPHALNLLAEGIGEPEVFTASDTLAAACAVLARYNTRLHPRTREIASATEIFREVLQVAGIPERHLCLEQLERAAGHFFRFFQRDAIPYADTGESVSYVRSAGRRIGVLTNVPYGMGRALVEEDLQVCGLADAVDILLTSQEVGWRKPEPHGFWELAERLGTAPERMCYVGNERVDVEGANRAGMISILIDRANARPAWGQQYRITSLQELVPLLWGDHADSTTSSA